MTAWGDLGTQDEERARFVSCCCDPSGRHLVDVSTRVDGGCSDTRSTLRAGTQGASPRRNHAYLPAQEDETTHPGCASMLPLRLLGRHAEPTLEFWT
jgi:hypothetical protein